MMAEMSELGQFLFELCSTMAKERARLYQHDKAAALDADRMLGIVTPKIEGEQADEKNEAHNG